MNGPYRSAFSALVIAAVLVSASACGRSSPVAPSVIGHVPVVVSLATPAGAPVLGSVASLRVDVRDAAGTPLGDPTIVPVTANETTFNVVVDAPAGEARTITVLAIGDRPITGAPEDFDDSGIGVLYRGVLTAVDVSARSNSTATLALAPFVPQLQPLEAAGGGVLVRWTPVPGAESYSLTRIFPNVGFTTVRVSGSSFIDTTGASFFQVTAIETSGRRSAPSDYLSVF